MNTSISRHLCSLALIALVSFVHAKEITPESIATLKDWKPGGSFELINDLQGNLLLSSAQKPWSVEGWNECLNLLASPEVHPELKLLILRFSGSMFEKENLQLLESLSNNVVLRELAISHISQTQGGDKSIQNLYNSGDSSFKITILNNLPEKSKALIENIAENALNQNEPEVIIVALMRLKAIGSPIGLKSIGRLIEGGAISKSVRLSDHVAEYLNAFSTEADAKALAQKLLKVAPSEMSKARALLVDSASIKNELKSEGTTGMLAWNKFSGNPDKSTLIALSKELTSLPPRSYRSWMNNVIQLKLVEVSSSIQEIIKSRPTVKEAEFEYRALSKIGGTENYEFMLSTLTTVDAGSWEIAKGMFRYIENPDFGKLLAEKIKQTSGVADRQRYLEIVCNNPIPGVYGYVVELYKKIPQNERQAPIWAIAYTTPPDKLNEVLTLFLEEQNDLNGNWASALNLIVPRVFKSTERNNLLINAVKTAPVEKQMILIPTLGLMNDEDFIPVLTQFIDSPNSSAVNVSLKAMGTIGTRESLKALDMWMKKNTDHAAFKLAQLQMVESFKRIEMSKEEKIEFFNSLLPQIRDIDGGRLFLSALGYQNNFYMISKDTIAQWFDALLKVDANLNADMEPIRNKLK